MEKLIVIVELTAGGAGEGVGAGAGAGVFLPELQAVTANNTDKASIKERETNLIRVR